MTLAAIAELLEDLHIGLDRGQLQTAFAVRDRLDARIALAVADYESAGLHEIDGAVSMNGWLRTETGRDAKTAAKVSSTGRKLRTLPALRDAVLDGVISGGQLDVIVACVPTRHVERFSAHESELVPRLAELGVDDTRRVMQHWKRHADALDDGPGPAEHDNELHLSRTIGGRGELHGSFDADITALIEAALRVADPKDFERSLCERRSDALAQICKHFLDHQRSRTGGRHRPHLNVVISMRSTATARASAGATSTPTSRSRPPRSPRRPTRVVRRPPHRRVGTRRRDLHRERPHGLPPPPHHGPQARILDQAAPRRHRRVHPPRRSRGGQPSPRPPPPAVLARTRRQLSLPHPPPEAVLPSPRC